MSFMLAMIAVLTSGLSMIRWLHTDQQWSREQLRTGGYFLFSYLLSIIMPILFVGLSLNCFIFAMLIAGFNFQNTVCRVITALWLVIYAICIGAILMEFAWRYAKSNDLDTDGSFYHYFRLFTVVESLALVWMHNKLQTDSRVDDTPADTACLGREGC
ncbi:uncharacterized protein HD556DRAFT_1405159 [Suillus plorans]|uniref:Uncharacterized protein n=1 Tax=Suillus plorans TaxID=116603 RepID=A0A9P7DDK0_9AGAM|nr:uncharacterized protein HD556DRAFT_1405159 [Suillus plorans]KAG1788097.1 hypothetical protein HD556DRAFT_1405159 [Suillus plorans]